MDIRAAAAIDYCTALIIKQEELILAGKFTQIEEYRAACAVVRNLKRQKDKIEEIFKDEDSDDHD